MVGVLILKKKSYFEVDGIVVVVCGLETMKKKKIHSIERSEGSLEDAHGVQSIQMPDLCESVQDQTCTQRGFFFSWAKPFSFFFQPNGRSLSLSLSLALQ